MKWINGFFILGLLLAMSCEKDQLAYKKFLNDNEIVYAGLAERPVARGGNLRVQLEWEKSIDPSVTTYVIYWNNGTDSAAVPATAADADGKYRHIVLNLPEYVQSFKLVTVNDRGFRSIGQTIDGVRIYGPFYNSGLINQRFSNAKSFGSDSVKLYFFKADSTKAYSRLWYYKQNGDRDSVTFSQDSVTLRSFKPGTRAAIQSYYVPPNAIDTFKTLKLDSLLAY